MEWRDWLSSCCLKFMDEISPRKCFSHLWSFYWDKNRSIGFSCNKKTKWNENYFVDQTFSDWLWPELERRHYSRWWRYCLLCEDIAASPRSHNPYVPLLITQTRDHNGITNTNRPTANHHTTPSIYINGYLEPRATKALHNNNNISCRYFARRDREREKEDKR